jgi:Ca2+-transporting ATPase
MHRSPRDPRAPLFSAALLAWSLIQGAAILLVVGAAFAGFVHLGWPAEQARAGCFVALVISNFGLIVLNRSFSASVVLALRRRNRALWRMLAGTTILLAATLFIPQGRELFRFGALEPGMLAAALGIGIVTTMLLALLKKLAREMPVAGHRAVVSP